MARWSKKEGHFASGGNLSYIKRSEIQNKTLKKDLKKSSIKH